MLARRVRSFIAQFAAGFAIQQWLVPAIVTAAGLLVGLRTGIPVFYVYVGSVLVFAQCFTGLSSFTDWKQRTTSRHKLAYKSSRVLSHLTPENECDGYILRLMVDNLATFPVEFKVKHLHTQIEGRVPVPPKRFHPIVVPPGGSGH